MRTKWGLWWTCPMIGKPLRINGSSRGRRTLMVVLLTTKLDLSLKGFRQIQGVDYDEIFSLVAMLKSVRIMLAIAAFYEIWQIDVKTAFLNGFLKELYMIQQKGFVDPKGANKVCKLQRSIYGLVQASRSWNIRFDKVIKAYGFIQTYRKACIYKKVSGSSMEFLILYVDDILLIGNDIECQDSIKGYLI